MLLEWEWLFTVQVIQSSTGQLCFFDQNSVITNPVKGHECNGVNEVKEVHPSLTSDWPMPYRCEIADPVSEFGPFAQDFKC